MEVAWDKQKAKSNKQKHGVSFEEAATVLADPNAIVTSDYEHGEDRVKTLGLSNKLRLLMVVHTEVVDRKIRLVSARKATKVETKQYAEAQR